MNFSFLKLFAKVFHVNVSVKQIEKETNNLIELKKIK